MTRPAARRVSLAPQVDHVDHADRDACCAPASAAVASSCCDGGCSASAPAPAVPAGPASAQTAHYAIANMDCPTEERLIRNGLRAFPRLARLDFDLMARRLVVHHHDADLDALTAALRGIGMRAERLPDDAPHAGTPAAPGWDARQKILLALSGLAALAAEALAWHGSGDHAPAVVLLSALSLAGTGWPTLRKGWTALRTRTLDIHFLMSLAVIGAIAIGQWPEAAMVIFLFTLAEMLESLSLDRVRHAVHALLKLAPDTVMRQTPAGEWQEAPASSAAPGDLIRVRAGERIALDGIVTDGASSVDQAPITGESMPVARHPGDAVYAGTVNGHGTLEVRVTAVSGDSTLARIVRLVEQAQRQRAPTQRFVDVFARYYTPAVVALAVLVAALPPLLTGAPFAGWLYKALVLLVIACPCALVISTPVAIVSGLTAAARRGILVKGGAFLEAGCRMTALAIDKTGTLTAGKPVVTQVRALAGAGHDDLLLLAASLEQGSDHPLAAAIRAAAPDAHSHLPVSAFAALPGRGVGGSIGGCAYHLGNRRLIEELGLLDADVETALQPIEGAAQSAVLLADETQVLGVIAIADALRPQAAQAVRRLRALGVATVMLSGDNRPTADRIGAEAAVDAVCADLLPEDKLRAVRRLQQAHGTVGMLGDGINDAPALAQADIGFAMGAAGSDAAIESADVALMDDDLGKVPAFIELSRATCRVLRQNIGAALAIKAVFFALALGGEATLWMAVFADVGASLLVVGNSLRLLRPR